MSGTAWPSVVVVIPSRLARASVAQAMRSVGAQDYPGEVASLLVVDRAEEDVTGYERHWASGADQVVWTGGVGRGGYARNVGVDASSADLVAFLDDDDVWLPSKLTLQVSALLQAEAAHADVVVSSRVVEVRSDTDERSVPVPRRCLKPTERVDDFLFRAREPRIGRASLHASTLLMRRTTARALRWDDDLRRHQDWDWVIRAQRGGAHLIQLPDVTVEHYLGSVGSVSASADWRASLDWSMTVRGQMHARTYTDLTCAQPLRYAIQARSWHGAAACLREMATTRRLPAPGPLLFALGSVVPRHRVERIVHRTARTLPGAPVSKTTMTHGPVPQQRVSVDTAPSAASEVETAAPPSSIATP